ncbi:hypothetical protein ACE6H2_003317 [Prunus campanulata]
MYTTQEVWLDLEPGASRYVLVKTRENIKVYKLCVSSTFFPIPCSEFKDC